MYQYLTDFHGKSQLFRFFALKSMWLRFFLETYMCKYLPLLFLITGIVVSFFIMLYKPVFGWFSLIIVAIIHDILLDKC